MHRPGLKIRFWSQAAATIGSNAYLVGLKTGNLYTGVLKHACVPTLNCYSCPAALFACPIGAMQVTVAGAGGLDLTALHTIGARLAAISTSLPLLVIGFLALIGGIVGRAACGWICPFGWFQELLNRIPSPKFNGPQVLKYLKYLILIVFVFLLPAFWLDEYDGGEPSFCKYICPAGTLEGGLPLAYLQPGLRSQLGWLFTWKATLLALLIAAAVFILPARRLLRAIQQSQPLPHRIRKRRLYRVRRLLTPVPGQPRCTAPTRSGGMPALPRMPRRLPETAVKNLPPLTNIC